MNKLLLTDSELKDIVLRYGSPLYLFYENEFRANFAHLCEAFRAVYKNYIPAYSYKTNYTPYVCGIVKEMGDMQRSFRTWNFILQKNRL